MPRRILYLTLTAILITAICWSAVSQTGEQVNLMLSTAPAGQDPQRYKGYVEPKYKKFDQRSLYLTMRDGVKIAIDVVLPQDLPAGEKLPTIVNMTRYWRSRQGAQPGNWFPQFGYARVMVDARGTGASYGIWRAPFSPDEIKDYGEVVNWIVAQPWSNGKVGSIGNSYEGNTALWLATTMHPAVKAVIPRHFEFDLFSETPYPGGLLTDWMVKTWNEGNRQLDTNEGVRLVDEDTDQRLFREATKQRAQNLDVYAAALKTVARDEREFGVSLDELSLHTHLPQIEKSGAAINSWGGWFDASTADAEIRSFLSLGNTHRAIVGPWNHGGSQNASPYQTAQSQRVMLQFEWLRFFDHYLKGIDTGLETQKRFYYFTLGEEKWKVTNTWPIAGTSMTRFYLEENNLLSKSAPKSESAEDRYPVNFEATTGEKNRWHTQVGGQVVYPDRAEEDKKLLTYTSAPLEADTEITGYPIANLLITSTATDGAFFVYLEDVDEAGKVTYVTEGVLRALHRKISKDTPPYKQLTPYHSFKKQDTMPLVPGQISELRFGLQPTSVLIKKGHRLRIAIAGHDKGTFARIPAEGNPIITVARNKRNASWIELPVISVQNPDKSG
ncbi:MAG TPA: CocE/NonD family hydrolase [Pyrinomonadaceae bacterium]|nr:CocE/NonD family hydrolase [Pyrinomonadaceae bacterium]